MVLCHTPTEKEENTQQDTGSGSNLRTTYVMVKSFRPKPVGIYPTSPGFTPFLSRKLSLLSYHLQFKQILITNIVHKLAGRRVLRLMFLIGASYSKVRTLEVEEI